MFFLRLLYHSFQRQPRRKLLAGAAVTLGIVMVTAMVTIANDVEDRMNRELRSVGANIVVRPASAALDLSIPGTALQAHAGDAYLREEEIPKVKQHFWSHNILGVTPILRGTAELKGRKVAVVGTWFAHPLRMRNEEFITGVKKTHNWWHVGGSWPAENGDEALVGERLAQWLRPHPGGSLDLGAGKIRIVGTLATGGPEDDAIVLPLHVAQRILGLPGVVQSIYVSALTKPEDDFARRDPRSMPPAVMERWMCSPYAASIAYQIDQALPSGHAEVVRAVARNEGVVLSRISGLMWLITVCASIAAGLAVSSSMATALFERQREIGLLRSLGATTRLIALLFFLEAAVLAALCGLAGFAGGAWLARVVAMRVFGSAVSANLALLPLVILIAGGITVTGSFVMIRRALRVQPSIVLRGEAA